MYIDPVRHSGRPTDDRIPQEMAIYDELERQGISFERVDHDHADTMEDCSRLSFADDGHMAQVLQTVPGSVSAMELLFDTEHRVQLVIDRELLADAFLSGHPGISTSTVRLTREDLLRYVEGVGHPPIYIDLPDPRVMEEQK